MIAALVFVIGLMILFAVLFSAFLVLPFFIFLAGIVAMVISDRKNTSRKEEKEAEVKVVETSRR